MGTGRREGRSRQAAVPASRGADSFRALRQQRQRASSPAVARARPPVKLRVLGTHVTLQEPIRRRAMEELGIELVFEPGGSAYVLQKQRRAPESFDLYEHGRTASGSSGRRMRSNRSTPSDSSTSTRSTH